MLLMLCQIPFIAAQSLAAFFEYGDKEDYAIYLYTLLLGLEAAAATAAPTLYAAVATTAANDEILSLACYGVDALKGINESLVMLRRALAACECYKLAVKKKKKVGKEGEEEDDEDK